MLVSMAGEYIHHKWQDQLAYWWRGTSDAVTDLQPAAANRQPPTAAPVVAVAVFREEP